MLTSGLYRYATPAVIDDAELQLRLQAKLRELIRQYGINSVLWRIRTYPVSAEYSAVKERILAVAYSLQ